MKLIVPKYYQNFKCRGGECSDNCCIGWEIDIDERTREKYFALPGSLGERIRENTVTEGSVCHFVLSGERCPFLNSDNLCDIITQKGEGYLSDICREHPRYYTTLGDCIFGGVGMCCEAAAELILTEKEPHEYITLDTDGEREECDGELLQIYLDLREEILKIFGRKTQSIVYTKEDLQKAVAIVQARADGEPEISCELREFSHEELVEIVENLELMTDELPTLLKKCGAEKEAELNNENINKYLHNILLYFLERYMPEAVCDGDFSGKFNIALFSLCVLATLFGAEENLTLERAVYLSKLYSKEVEYNEENIEKISCIS